MAKGLSELELARLKRCQAHKLRSAACRVDTGDATKVQQQYAAELDVNTIVRRFGLTQQAPYAVPGGFYADFTGITDYESALAAVERARVGFMGLPAEARDKFGNDPGRFLAFAGSASEAEIISVCGLAPTPVVPGAVPPSGGPALPSGPAAPAGVPDVPGDKK